MVWPAMAVEPNGPGGQVKELRLALVLYGGVSLCVYMHGITKELHRLVRASVPAAGGPQETAPASEQVWRRLLGRLAERASGVATRVVVDVVAGTSAGGINGVYLAKALAHDLSQDALRDLWIGRGAISGLLRGPRVLPGWSKSVTLPLALRRAPLDGASMCEWLHDALVTMDTTAAVPGRSLMPDGHELQLFVTMTDLRGYERDVVADDPHIIRDRQHGHVMSFRYQPARDVDDFGPPGNAALTFAARATSCFPGAFAPVSPGSVSELLSDRGAADTAIPGRFFRLQELAGPLGGDPLTSRFIDGGVLDNRPFDHAIRAIRSRRADTEVDRRLLYVDPDPHPLAEGPPPAGPDEEPAEIPTILAALTKIPRQQPILGALLEAASLNDRVARIAELVTASFDPIARQVEAVVGGAIAEIATAPDGAALAEWRRRIHERASEGSGRLAYWTYARMKLADAVEGYARTVCTALDYPTESNHAQLVRGALRAWARDRGLFAEDPDRLLGERGELLSAEQVDFLRTFDIGYGARLLRFVLAGLNAWYAHAGEPGYPDRAALDAAKAALWARVKRLDELGAGTTFAPEVVAEIERAFPAQLIDDRIHRTTLDDADFASMHAAELDRLHERVGGAYAEVLRDFSAETMGEINTLTVGWPPERREDLLVRYLGYPLWDAVLFPVQRLSDAGERDRVEIIRMSPADASVLRFPGAEKLQGIGLHHFRAFFRRDYRECDYLWGRLDAAARMVELLRGGRDQEYVAWFGELADAILTEDAEQLTSPGATALIAELRAELAAAPAQAAPARS